MIKCDEVYNSEMEVDFCIPYVKLSDTAITPTRADKYSAGFDLYADIEKPVTIQPGEVYKISTGIAMELPDKTFGAIFARSGLATKSGLGPCNFCGICDSSYRGDYIVALRNFSNSPATVNPGDRIAQLIIMPYYYTTLCPVDKLSETERGDGGFGHSGT